MSTLGCALVALATPVALFTAHANAASPPPFSWDTVPYTVMCHNFSGPLNDDMVDLMAHAGWSAIDGQQCQYCDPANTSAEIKMATAAKQIRTVNPNAVILMYETSDTIRNYSLVGQQFLRQPNLLIKNDRVYNWAEPEAVSLWASNVAKYVQQGQFDGVMIDGYRFECLPDHEHVAQRSEQAETDNNVIQSKVNLKPCPFTEKMNSTYAKAFLNGYWNMTGPALAAALPKDAIMLPNCEGGHACQDGNGSTIIPGYNGVYEEFFQAGVYNHTDPKDSEDIASLQRLALKGTLAAITTTDERDIDGSIQGLAQFLIGAGENQYYQAIGWYWQCSEIPIKTLAPLYKKPLGTPTAVASVTTLQINSKTSMDIYHRKFAKGTTVSLNVTHIDGPPWQSVDCLILWGDGTNSTCKS